MSPPVQPRVSPTASCDPPPVAAVSTWCSGDVRQGGRVYPGWWGQGRPERRALTRVGRVHIRRCCMARLRARLGQGRARIQYRTVPGQCQTVPRQCPEQCPYSAITDHPTRPTDQPTTRPLTTRPTRSIPGIKLLSGGHSATSSRYIQSLA